MMMNIGLPNIVLAPEKSPTITMHGRVFQMTVGDTCFYELHQTVSKTVIYTDSQAGKNYTVESIAYSQNQEITRFLYINGQCQSIATFWHAVDNNALYYHCSEPKNAVDWALAHAESLVGNMAFNDNLI